MTAKEALAVLCAAFQVKHLDPPMQNLYLKKFADIPGALLENTVHQVVNEAEMFGVLPPIARIRKVAAQISGRLPPRVEEALAVVRAASVERPVYRRDGSYAYTEREWCWPEEASPVLVTLIRQTLGKVGDPVGQDENPIFGWEQQFKAAYEQCAAEVTTAALVDLSLAALPEPPPPLALPAPIADSDSVERLPVEDIKTLVAETVDALSRKWNRRR